MKADEKTRHYFQRVQQVFLYLSDRCNLLCRQCLYKPNVLMGRSMEPGTAIALLDIFAGLGAYKLTVLGGELSLYDREHDWDALKTVLRRARELGYRYIRIDTNGQLTEFFDCEELFMYIDEVSFSIDGYNPETNDALRGAGSFRSAMESFRSLKKKPWCPKVNITACVTRQNTAIAGGIDNFINAMTDFAESLSVDQINFHGVFRMGVAMDAWTEDSHLDATAWYRVIRKLSDGPIHDRKVDVRLPLHIISREEFEKHPRYYGYCPCKLGERALIHPDGIVRVCSSMLSTPYGVAHYNAEELVWNEYNNELYRHEMDQCTPCTNQSALYSDGLCPICFSIKPYQNEPVWVNSRIEELKGDNRP